ncbi:unnamed protein product [Dracunculus medinensis]|uniref:CS domain-containing protein n=1 Tax=Dracunculus medinensis TaxID=318479 RepID=A0A158Q558_DRAME|nr:unnamed protein product [Dracunculus medinensis]
MVPCPFVYWAQNEMDVFLTVALRDSASINFTVHDDMVVFRGTGIGAQGRMEYAFTLKLFDGVELKNADQSNESRLFYILKKTRNEWWPTLTKETNRLTWLRVDFERFQDPELNEKSSDDDFEMLDYDKNQNYELDELTRKVLGDYGNSSNFKDITEKLKSFRKLSKRFVEYYLILYNIFVFVMHLYALTTLLLKAFINGIEYFDVLWGEIFLFGEISLLFLFTNILNHLLRITTINVAAVLLQASY